MLGYEACANKTEKKYFINSLLSLKTISFVLFSYASKPSMNFSVSKLVCYQCVINR